MRTGLGEANEPAVEALLGLLSISLPPSTLPMERCIKACDMPLQWHAIKVASRARLVSGHHRCRTDT